MDIAQPQRAVTVEIPVFKFFKFDILEEPEKLIPVVIQHVIVEADTETIDTSQVNQISATTVPEKPKELTPTQEFNPAISFLEDSKLAADIFNAKSGEQNNVDVEDGNIETLVELEPTVVFAPVVRQGYKPLMPGLVAQAGVTYQEAELVMHGPPKVKRGLRRR
jgi:hypothetical protein